ncbi:sulfate adenylyltransferase small subunit [Bordetella genomosp. 11]|uniref:Sulfate adenylyltransferase subunit 2 n=2 Tax=Bordetella genomosp. 11 TaxID=1416808 RepID=A0A261UNK4_9BORD|nr:sulfate adenylyltransferase small subunit [Bordetella genomosp. 11]
MDESPLHGLDASRVWDTSTAFEHLQRVADVGTKRTAERRLQELLAFPAPLDEDTLEDDGGRKPVTQVIQQVAEDARSKRHLVVFAQLAPLPGGRPCLHLNDARGGRYWMPLSDDLNGPVVAQALGAMQKHIGKPLTVFPHGALVPLVQSMEAIPQVEAPTFGYPPRLSFAGATARAAAGRHTRTPHLDRLEAESIHIIREAVAEADNPAMLYSVGKDSSVMLHLARKAFYPAPPPFPLVHVDTRWKFQEMYLFRDRMARDSGMDLLVHVNPEAIARNINPFDHGSSLHTDITKTQGLKQVLDERRFDIVFGGARRDEEKSRAKERIFSFRTAAHRWDPKNQRPELWNLYNARKRPGESIRAFPLSNWTELDIWQYIYSEDIPVVPLYFAKERPVIVRDGMILMVDDDRMRLAPGERIQFRKVRFRTLGCYPLTGAVESNAATVPEIILELIGARSSERQGRAIDTDAAGSMEKKKQEGYF